MSNNWSEYEVLGRIGEGQFSQVDVVRHRQTGSVYAAKRMVKSTVFRCSQNIDAQLERDIMATAREPRKPVGSEWEYIPRLFSAFQTPSELVLVSTYYPCGSLWDVMNLAPTAPVGKSLSKYGAQSDGQVRRALDQSAIQHYASQVALAISYLHRIGVVHRDIKPHNVLIGLNGKAVISDFGSAALLIVNNGQRGLSHGDISPLSVLKEAWSEPRFVPQSSCTTIHGTLDYIAPEVLVFSGKFMNDVREVVSLERAQTVPETLTLGYDASVDWWSYGAMLYEMTYGLPPFYAESVESTYKMIVDCKEPIVPPDIGAPDQIGKPLRDLLQKLLSPASVRLGRTGALAITSHPFFEGTDWAGICSGTRSVFKAPDPIDIDDLCDSFACGEWSIDSHCLRPYEGSQPDGQCLGWNIPAFLKASSVSPDSPKADHQHGNNRNASSDFQTPMRSAPARLPLRTPYPPGTAVRKAPAGLATHRKISDRKAAERLFSCVVASAGKEKPTSWPPKQANPSSTYGKRDEQKQPRDHATSLPRSATMSTETAEQRHRIESIAMQSHSLRTQLNVR